MKVTIAKYSIIIISMIAIFITYTILFSPSILFVSDSTYEVNYENFDYPESNYCDSDCLIIDKNGVNDATKLMNLHTNRITFENNINASVKHISDGYVYSSTSVKMDNNGGIITTIDDEMYMYNESKKYTMSGDISQKQRIWSERYSGLMFDSGGFGFGLRSASNELTNTEKEMYQIIESSDYKATEVYEKNNKGYIVYESYNGSHHMIIEENGLIVEFEYNNNNTEIYYKVDTHNVLPVVEPHWYLN